MSSELLLGVNDNYYGYENFNDESRVRKTGRHRKTGHYNSKNVSRVHSENTRYNKDGDSFTVSKPQKTGKKGMSKGCKRVLTLFLAMICALIMKQAMASGSTTPVADYETNGMSISEIAKENNVNEGAILRANNLTSEDEIPEKIVMPEKYTALDDAITMLEGKLDSANLNDEDKEILNEVYNQMLAKKEQQDEAGSVSTDGKYVYITLNKNTDALTLKKIYGIPDGATRENNKVSPSYSTSETSSPDYGPAGYWNYDTYKFKKGETIKIPVADFNTDFQALLASI